MYPPVIKHGELENPAFRHLHLVRGIPATAMRTPEGTCLAHGVLTPSRMALFINVQRSSTVERFSFQWGLYCYTFHESAYLTLLVLNVGHFRE